ncbi:hypothetical protein GP486_002783 [Trichoglossum hirsutum]|uniref:Protein required for cell viability n=1 Tax=Trichoglossum hirsutum TaxID=265104 RepID=A0A9P8LE48_9PEZI|nr:hypothetical protein GP486_002783 [Trichoglossum hirsutum]
MYGLFDLVSLEGIYPLLSPGVGIPLERRVKSVLPVGVIARQAPSSSTKDWSASLLQEVVDCLQGICLNRRIGLGPICQERVLVDLISACGELAFGPNVEDGVTTAKYNNIFRILVGDQLSAKEYFSQLAPQLFDLLDGQAGPEMAKAAAFIIAGILGQKAHGAPGKAGWNAFAEPLLVCIDPDPFVPDPAQEQCGSTLIPESDLKLALGRLTTLTTSHPNPGLSKRLIGRVLFPLWGLLCFAKKTKKTVWYEQTAAIIRLYLKLSADVNEIVKLAEEMLFDGRIARNNREGWAYGPGGEGGIEIRRRPKVNPQITNMIEQIGEIDTLVGEFLLILGSGVVDGSIGEVFLGISRRLLRQSRSPDSTLHRLVVGGDSDPRDSLQVLIDAKIAQGLLEKFRERLAEKPTQMFELINQLLEEFVERCKAQRRLLKELKEPSLTGIGHISQFPTTIGGAITEPTAEGESIDIVSTGLSLLTAILTSLNSDIGEQDKIILSSIQTSLEFISSPFEADIPIALSGTATNLLSLLSIHSSLLPPASLASSSSPNPLVEDKKTYALALSYLSETLVPVRAQGLHLLETLIQSRSPLLDVQATITLLLSLLQDEDEFIYLNAIKTLTTLADRHGNTITKALVERYVDRGEDLGLDQRLKLGEALLRIVQRTGAALIEETARVLGDGVVEVAGRRGRRLREMEERQRQARKEEARNKEAEEAWGGEVPQIGEDEETERLVNITKGWESESGEEDTRVRTSALSIYGTAVETNAAGLGSLSISTAIDLVVSILTIENQDERAILRRAAAMLILSVLKALDEAEENGRNLGFGFAGESLAEVITVLKYVQATDNDGLVREYAETIVRELGVWRAKSLLRAPTSVDVSSSLANLSRGQLVGLPLRNSEGGTRPSIEEIE